MAAPRAQDSSISQPPVVLLTGASSGIGLALAERLRASTAAHIILTARATSLERLRDAGFEESERLWLRPLDIVDSDQREGLIREADQQLGGVDVLINNAGITYRGVTEHMDPLEALNQLQTNYIAPLALVRLVLPSMRRKRRGRIINVSSVSGMMAMPTMGAYSASKFALEGATESLWYEMKPWNIKVTLVQPGFIHSNSFRNVIMTREAEESLTDTSDPYHAVYAHMGPFIERLMGLAFATPDDIAKRILATLEQSSPRLRIFATIDARLFYMLRRLLPRRFFHALLFRSLPGVRSWGPPD